MTTDDIKKYKDSLYTALSRDLADFEKNFLLIVAGILTFSISFIKDIVKIDAAEIIGFLFAGWLLMAIAVALMILTFINSAYASDDITAHIDSFMAGKGPFPDNILPVDIEATLKETTRSIVKKRKASLREFRKWAITSFLSGILIFGWFVGYNMYIENHQKKTTATVKASKGVAHELILDGIRVTLTDSSIIIKK